MARAAPRARLRVDEWTSRMSARARATGLGVDVHNLRVHEALALLETDRERGLTSEEAVRRLQRYGPNVLPRAERRGWPVRLLLQFHHPLIYVLLVSAVATCAIGEPVDASVIVGVVLANAAVGFVQEARAERALDALAAMITVELRVIRDGNERTLPARDLVPGDVVAVAPGDKVSADIRLIDVSGLQVDESALTGESVPVAKAEWCWTLRRFSQTAPTCCSRARSSQRGPDAGWWSPPAPTPSSGSCIACSPRRAS
jgi:magnesium-transporting ATPase (P-type)